MDLSAIRVASGLSQVQLADKIGKKHYNISNLERQVQSRSDRPAGMTLKTLIAYLIGTGADVRLTAFTVSGVVTYRLDPEAEDFVLVAE